MDGSTTLKYFLSSNSTLSHGGLASTHENPPDQPVSGSACGLSSSTWKIPGNSRCQWKKLYSSRSRSISVAVGGGSALRPFSFSAVKTRLTIAGGASSRLIQTKAAHQASATRRLAWFSADSSQSW